MAPPRVMKSSSMGLEDEADSSCLFCADLDVAQGRRRNEVDGALGVGQRQVSGGSAQNLGDGLLDVSRRLARLEADFAGGVGNADSNIHQGYLPQVLRPALGPCVQIRTESWAI